MAPENRPMVEANPRTMGPGEVFTLARAMLAARKRVRRDTMEPKPAPGRAP